MRKETQTTSSSTPVQSPHSSSQSFTRSSAHSSPREASPPPLSSTPTTPPSPQSPPLLSNTKQRWKRYWSDEHDCAYFHNEDTDEVTWNDPHSYSYTKLTKVTLDDDDFTHILDFSKKNTSKKSCDVTTAGGNYVESNNTSEMIDDDIFEQEDCNPEPINGAFYANKRKGQLRRKMKRKILLETIRNALLLVMICHYGFTHLIKKKENPPVAQQEQQESTDPQEAESPLTTQIATFEIQSHEDYGYDSSSNNKISHMSEETNENNPHDDQRRQDQDAGPQRVTNEDENVQKKQDHTKKGEINHAATKEILLGPNDIPLKTRDEISNDDAPTKREEVTVPKMSTGQEINKNSNEENDESTFNGINLKAITKESSGYIKFENGKIVRIEMGRDNIDPEIPSIATSGFHKPPKHLDPVSNERNMIPIGSYDSDELETLENRVDEFKGFLNSIKAQAKRDRNSYTDKKSSMKYGGLESKNERESNQEDLQDFIQEAIRKEIQKSIQEIITNNVEHEENISSTETFPFLQKKTGKNNIAQNSPTRTKASNHGESTKITDMKQKYGTETTKKIIEKIRRVAIRRKSKLSGAVSIIAKKRMQSYCRVPLLKKMFKGCKKHNTDKAASSNQNQVSSKDLKRCNLPFIQNLISKECMQKGDIFSLSFDVQDFVHDLI